jgi:hypothetical protein
MDWCRGSREGKRLQKRVEVAKHQCVKTNKALRLRVGHV